MSRNVIAGAALAMIAGITYVGQGAITYQVDFNSNTGNTINGVIGGTAAVWNPNPSLGSTVGIDTTPTMGDGGFLSFDLTSNQAIGSRLTPTGTNGFNGITTNSGGQTNMVGGFDFFFRSSVDITGTNSGPGNRLAAIGDVDTTYGAATGLDRRLGLRLESSDRGDDSAVTLGLFSSYGDPFSQFTNVQNSAQFNNGTFANILNIGEGSKFTIAANTVYHIGATFATENQDVIRVRLFVAEGDTPINTTLDTHLIGEATFKLTESQGFNPATIVFGHRDASNRPYSQDFDMFRIYTGETPTSFAALVPEPTTLGIFAMAMTGLLGRRRKS